MSWVNHKLRFLEKSKEQLAAIVPAKTTRARAAERKAAKEAEEQYENRCYILRFIGETTRSHQQFGGKAAILLNNDPDFVAALRAAGYDVTFSASQPTSEQFYVTVAW